MLEIIVIRADSVLTIADGPDRANEISLSPEYGLPHSSVQRAVAFGVQSLILGAFSQGLALNVQGGGEAAPRASG